MPTSRSFGLTVPAESTALGIAFSAHRGTPRARHSQVIASRGFRAAQRPPASAEAVSKRMTSEQRPAPTKTAMTTAARSSFICVLLATFAESIVRPVVIECDLFHPRRFFLAKLLRHIKGEIAVAEIQFDDRAAAFADECCAWILGRPGATMPGNDDPNRLLPFCYPTTRHGTRYGGTKCPLPSGLSQQFGTWRNRPRQNRTEVT